MRALAPLVLLGLLAAPAGLAAVEPPIPLGNGVFLDGGELVATVEFEVLEGGCGSALTHVRIMRHFLGFDKERFVWADTTCVRSGDGLALVLVGNEALTPESNLKLAGGGADGQLVSLSGTYRDGYMSVHLPARL